MRNNEESNRESSYPGHRAWVRSFFDAVRNDRMGTGASSGDEVERHRTEPDMPTVRAPHSDEQGGTGAPVLREQERDDHHDDCAGIHFNRSYNFHYPTGFSNSNDETAPFNTPAFIKYLDYIDNLDNERARDVEYDDYTTDAYYDGYDYDD